MVDESESHTLKVLRQMRREQADNASTLARLMRNTEDRLTRQVGTLRDDIERRMATLRDELEATIKMEIGGSLAHLETRLEDRMEDRLDDLRREHTPHP